VYLREKNLDVFFTPQQIREALLAVHHVQRLRHQRAALPLAVPEHDIGIEPDVATVRHKHPVDYLTARNNQIAQGRPLFRCQRIEIHCVPEWDDKHVAPVDREPLSQKSPEKILCIKNNIILVHYDIR
jgi:hypothetical protein